MKKRIMFVDDEPNILEGLRFRLRPRKDQWAMRFASGGEEALTLLSQEICDVLVTDMRMPGMDGAALLQKVKELYPEIVRIVLSGHAEFEASLRAIPVAHQFLSKPCDINVLEDTIIRTCNLQELVSDPKLRHTIGQIAHLPPMPKTFTKLQSVLAKEDFTSHEIAILFRQDAAMSAKILHIVNSAFFRLARSISKVEEAVTYLGAETLQRVVLAAELFSIRTKIHLPGSSIEKLQCHSLLTASIASRRVPPALQEDTFLAALLHDVGKMVLAEYLPDRLIRAHQESEKSGQSVHAEENRLFGITHAEIGAYLLGIWGLPYFIAEAVANHHTPSKIQSDKKDVLMAVYFGNLIAHALAEDPIPIDPECSDTIDIIEATEEYRELYQMVREQLY